MDPTGFTVAAVTDDLAIEPRARDHADIIEFRMDLAADPITSLDTYSGVLPILATNRVTSEGGDAPPGETRLDTIATAATHSAVHAVDIELDTLTTDRGRRVAREARESGAIVVASTHDFDGTPDRDPLDDRLARTATVGDIGKVAVTNTDLDDALTLLTATRAATVAGHNVAAIGMGAPGRHTRIIAPVYGSKIAYAPVVPADATAPGQYDLQTLHRLLDAVR